MGNFRIIIIIIIDNINKLAFMSSLNVQEMQCGNLNVAVGTPLPPSRLLLPAGAGDASGNLCLFQEGAGQAAARAAAGRETRTPPTSGNSLPLLMPPIAPPTNVRIYT